MALTVLYRAHPTKRLFDALVVVPAYVLIDQGEHLVAGVFLPLLGVDRLGLHPAEEPLRGRVVRRTAFRARRTRQVVVRADADPFGPPVVAAAVEVKPMSV